MSDAQYHSYEPREGHQLPHDPLKACVAPRPIGWISTIGPTGTLNLAPYSYFNIMNDNPPMCFFGSAGHKDTLANVERTGEFVHNVVAGHLVKEMNTTATTLPEDVDEFAAAGVTPMASQLVKPPRVAESPIQLECKLHQIIDLPSNTGNRAAMVIAEIVAVHISQEVMDKGLVDLNKVKPLTRLGYMQYAEFGEMFSLFRPKTLGDKPEISR